MIYLTRDVNSDMLQVVCHGLLCPVVHSTYDREAMGVHIKVNIKQLREETPLVSISISMPQYSLMSELVNSYIQDG